MKADADHRLLKQVHARAAPEAVGAGPDPNELDLLGALGEMDREGPTQLPSPPRREARGLRVHRVRGVHADPRAHSLGQILLQPPHLSDDGLHYLSGRRPVEIPREEFGVHSTGQSAPGELRQALAVGRGLGHERRPGHYRLAGGVASRLRSPGLLLWETLYEPPEPASELTALRRVLATKSQVGVGIDGPGNNGVFGKEPYLRVRGPAPKVGERPDGSDAPVADENGPILDR